MTERASQLYKSFSNSSFNGYCVDMPLVSRLEKINWLAYNNSIVQNL